MKPCSSGRIRVLFVFLKLATSRPSARDSPQPSEHVVILTNICLAACWRASSTHSWKNRLTRSHDRVSCSKESVPSPSVPTIHTPGKAVASLAHDEIRSVVEQNPWLRRWRDCSGTIAAEALVRRSSCPDFKSGAEVHFCQPQDEKYRLGECVAASQRSVKRKK